MNIKIIDINSKIVLLIFDTQLDITSTFLRFQEHYESPKFRNKIFSLKEYKDWYIEEKGSFSYYEDWNGFNIPSYVLSPFKEGKFDPLDNNEKYLLDVLEEYIEPFYVIGVHKGNLDNIRKTLEHEVAHGLFYTREDYRDEVLSLIREYDLDELKSFLRGLGGYCDEVIEDECHAYHINGSRKTKELLNLELQRKLVSLFNRYLENQRIDLDDIEKVI